ncbi:MAG: redoxin domain-containing protein [Phycisphaerales bacterium]|nr:redoxin domain-containing protein [Phycisphaerales bacterium]
MKINSMILGLATAAAVAIGSSALACDTCAAHAKAPPSKDAPAKAAPTKDKMQKEATIGQKAPHFELVDLDGKKHKLSDYAGKIVVLEWYNPDCPFSGKASGQSVYKRGTVQRTHDAAKAMDSDVVYMLINSTSNAPKDAVVKRSKESRDQWKIATPILIDHGGAVGKMYKAKTTPHMYVINGDGVLIYEGAYTDDRRGGKGDKEENYVIGAMTAAQSGESCSPSSTRPWGCGVKYGR